MVHYIPIYSRKSRLAAGSAGAERMTSPRPLSNICQASRGISAVGETRKRSGDDPTWPDDLPRDAVRPMSLSFQTTATYPEIRVIHTRRDKREESRTSFDPWNLPEIFYLRIRLPEGIVAWIPETWNGCFPTVASLHTKWRISLSFMDGFHRGKKKKKCFPIIKYYMSRQKRRDSFIQVRPSFYETFALLTHGKFAAKERNM